MHDYKQITITNLWANTADDKVMVLFLLFFQQNRTWHVMQIVSNEMSKCFLGKIRKNITMLSVENFTQHENLSSHQEGYHNHS